MSSYIGKLDHRLWSEEALDKPSSILNIVPIFSIFHEPWKDLLRTPRKELITRFFFNIAVYSIPFFASPWFIVTALNVNDKTGAVYGLMFFGFLMLAIGLVGIKEVAKLGFYLFISKRNIVEVLESQQTFKGLKQ